jgi:hypothetical protein
MIRDVVAQRHDFEENSTRLTREKSSVAVAVSPAFLALEPSAPGALGH